MAGFQQSPMIGRLNKQFIEAFKTRDFAAVAEMFTDDAVMLPPRRNIIAGKSNIQSFWTRAARFREMKFATDSVTTLAADVLREIGTLRMRVTAPSRDQNEDGESGAAGEVQAVESRSKEILGKYVFLWRKINGEWKLETSIWNQNRPDKASRRPRRRRARE